MPTPIPLRPELTSLTARCNALIVDDEVGLAETIASSLTRDGINVRTAHSGSSALRVIQSFQPRVALLDYRLPDMTGVGLRQSCTHSCPISQSS
jgi:DNA-binding response OmpR family regulator